MTAERIESIGDLILARTPLADWPAEFFVVQDNVRRADILLAHALEPGDAIRAALQRGARGWSERAANERSWREAYVGAAQGPIATLEEIKRSNLRGRGGAGFTTGIKWEACRHATGLERYVVCNADEGEPGTFKDRVLLTSHADLLFDGMTVAAYAIGASRGFLYLRGEYRYLLEPLEAVLERRREANLLGAGICGQPGFDFDIRIHVGAGSYVCGEESALIESLEGKRGVPRNRPPYPVTQRLPAAADDRQQRRDAVRGGADRGARRRLVPRPRHAEVRPAPRSCRSPATSRGPASTSTRSA